VKQQGVAATGIDDEWLKRFVCERTKHSKKIDEIALSRPIGTDEHVEIFNLERFKCLNRLEAGQGNLSDCTFHQCEMPDVDQRGRECFDSGAGSITPHQRKRAPLLMVAAHALPVQPRCLSTGTIGDTFVETDGQRVAPTHAVRRGCGATRGLPFSAGTE
jgi:hypothetical protein